MGRTSLHTDEKLLKTGAALARKKGLSGFTVRELCAKSKVQKPKGIFNEVKNSIKPMAVTISGFSIERLLTWDTVSLMSLLERLKPMAATVPTMVEIMVAKTAMTTE